MPEGGLMIKPGGKFQSNHGNDVMPVEQVPGAHRHVLADGAQMMILEWRMDAGVSVPLHNHPHEQSGYVISGQMNFTADGKEHVLTPGMGYLVMGTEPHGAHFPIASVVFDIFSPPREDYRSAKASTYTLTAAKPTRKGAVAKKKPVAKKKVATKKKK